LKTCFLIDDDEDDREIFQLALMDVGGQFDCITADNCREALQQLRNGALNPDYIFLDLNMPVLSGKDCLAEIRKMARFNQTPVLIYTTSADKRDKDEIARLGGTAFITKPNRVSALTEILKQVLTA